MSIEKLRKLIGKLKNAENAILSEADKIMFKNSKELVEYNKEQLLDGLNSEEEVIKYKHTRKGLLNANRSYTERYDRYKSKRGLQTHLVDLKLSGDFYDSIRFVSKEKNKFMLISEDEKAVYLKNNYGEDILGIQDDNLQKFSDDKLKPDLEKFLNKYIG